MFDQPSTHYRADAGSDRAKARPGSDGATAFVLCERTADDGKTAGNEERRAKSLKCAGGDQLSDVGGKSARGRRACEKRDPDQKKAATAVKDARRTANEQKRREQERTGFADHLTIAR